MVALFAPPKPLRLTPFAQRSRRGTVDIAGDEVPTAARLSCTEGLLPGGIPYDVESVAVSALLRLVARVSQVAVRRKSSDI
ncbi:hypothetical protein DOTSEDRAFT_67826 [Dothistroma septosporum NZE10]|uniref:Uncharacterized protein n=1 Tax=Dothistroma septosporum (strain NZE10 / CBS 128990) TaxID=675120 RepID=N1PZN3_DOTSN|nr:hypothetical protein DOTSEDRAFT_67826 [Dothistroma septosporum NZE10]